MNYACEAAIGSVSGLRSFTAPALLSGAAHRKLLNLKRTPFAWLASDRSARISALLAGGELLADKLPFMPKRTEAPSLVARFISGAVCAMAIAGRRKGKERIASALVGGTAAIAASYAGYQYRKHVKLPPVVAALLEDSVALGAGAAIIRRVCD